jgi:hypothetical protein
VNDTQATNRQRTGNAHATNRQQTGNEPAKEDETHDTLRNTDRRAP